jgi:hypothetical protein
MYFDRTLGIAKWRMYDILVLPSGMIPGGGEAGPSNPQERWQEARPMIFDN